MKGSDRMYDRFQTCQGPPCFYRILCCIRPAFVSLIVGILGICLLEGNAPCIHLGFILIESRLN